VAQGHRLVTVDLPSEDQEAGADAYARVVAEQLGDERDVVLIGHSLAGLTIPVVAMLRRWVSQLPAGAGRGALPRLPARTCRLGGRATARQHWRVTREVTPLATRGTTPSTAIVCTEDRVLDAAWSRTVAERELGVAPVELPGGHSPFLAQPGRLAQVVCDIASADATTPG
jgi:pimeloyl-ACP methyl ester carboxylesterase